MAFKDTSIHWKINICLQASALIVCLVGFGTNHLVYLESSYLSYNGGLWETYFNDAFQWNTDDFLRIYKQSSEWLDVSKAMMSISVGLHIICTTLTVGLAFLSPNKLAMWGLASIEFTAALSGLIGCSVAVSKLKSAMEDVGHVTLSVGYSFILFLVAQFAFALAGLVILLDVRMNAIGAKRPAPVAAVATIF